VGRSGLHCNDITFEAWRRVTRSRCGVVTATTTSVLDQKFACFVLGAVFLRQKRSIEARMWSADLVHLKGLGSALCWSRKDLMSARRAATLR
jgi:hypothetical protein